MDDHYAEYKRMPTNKLFFKNLTRKRFMEINISQTENSQKAPEKCLATTEVREMCYIASAADTYIYKNLQANNNKLCEMN